jgi:hypothetical protein
MMRRYVAAFALVGLLATLAAGQHALAQDTVDNTRRSMGNLRPGSPGAGHHAPARHHADDTRRSMGNLRPGSHAAVGTAQGSNRTILVVPQPYYGGYGYPYDPRYRPYYPGGYGYYPYYSAPYPYYYGPYVYPPVYVAPDTLYGPRALRRFMGLGW